jgi:uncharacterized protein (UPF0333 family)
MRNIIIGTIVLIVLSIGLYKALSHKKTQIENTVLKVEEKSLNSTAAVQAVNKNDSNTEIEKNATAKDLSVYENVIEKIVSSAENVKLVAWALSDNDRNASVSEPNQEFLRVYVQCIEYNKTGVAGVEKRDCNKVHNKRLTTLLFRQ